MPYIDIRVEFDKEIEEDYDDYWVHHTPTKVSFLQSDIKEEELDAIGESAGQSDRYQVGVSNAVLAVLDGGTAIVKH